MKAPADHRLDETTLAARGIALNARETRRYLDAIGEDLSHLTAWVTDSNYRPGSREDQESVRAHIIAMMANIGHAHGELQSIALDAATITGEEPDPR